MKTPGYLLLLTIVLFASCMRPFNTIKDCRVQCEGSDKSEACYDFCDCIHKQGRSLDSCLDEYDKAPADARKLDAQTH